MGLAFHSGVLGGLGGASMPYGASPLTPVQFLGKFGPQLGENRFALGTGASVGWRAYQVDRPTILWAGNALITGPIFYTSGKVPTTITVTSGISVPSLAGAATQTTSDPVQISTRHGICFLSGPGIWWLYNSGTLAQEMIAIDASEPANAVRYLAESGSAKWSNSAVVNVTTSSIEIMAQNRARGATIITHTSLDGIGGAFTGIVWIAFEAAAASKTGLALLSGQTIALTGELNYRGRIRATITAGANGCDVAVQEVIT